MTSHNQAVAAQKKSAANAADRKTASRLPQRTSAWHRHGSLRLRAIRWPLAPAPSISPTLKREKRRIAIFSPSFAMAWSTSSLIVSALVLDEVLLVEAILFVEFFHLAGDDLLDHRFRLAGRLGLFACRSPARGPGSPASLPRAAGTADRARRCASPRRGTVAENHPCAQRNRSRNSSSTSTPILPPA